MKDNINIKEGKWQFDENVSSCFQDMLNRSIPDYSTMRELTYRIGSKYIVPNTDIIDIGCSQGEAIAPFIEKFGNKNKYYLYDTSRPMLDIVKRKYDELIEDDIVNVQLYDIKNGLTQDVIPSLVISSLTIQFTPIEYRQNIIQSVYDKLIDGGAFIFIEKILGDNANMNDLLVDTYYSIKADNGYSLEQIINKKRSLEGVLVPIKDSWNKEMLKQAGFKHIDCFWKCLNFAGYIAIK